MNVNARAPGLVSYEAQGKFLTKHPTRSISLITFPFRAITKQIEQNASLG
jgi:hypothetical protein